MFDYCRNGGNHREVWLKNTINVAYPTVKASMIQDLGFQSPTEQVLNFTKIKEEIPPNSFSKFGEMVEFDNHSNVEESLLEPSMRSYMKHGQQQPFRDQNENLCWLSTNSSEGLQLLAGDSYSNAHRESEGCYGSAYTSSRFNFSHVFPTTNILPNLDFSSSLSSNSLGLNLKTLDLLASANYGGGSSRPSHDDHFDPFKESLPLDHDLMQESSHDFNPSKSSKMVGIFL